MTPDCSYVVKRFDEAYEVASNITPAFIAEVATIAELCVERLKAGNTIFFCGNGGSAADAMHLAAELSGFFKDRDRIPFRAMALGCNQAHVTAVSNDNDYSQAMVREAKALMRKGDILFAMTTSGKSPNVMFTLIQARQLGAKAVLVTGGLCPKGHVTACDYHLVIPSANTPRIQEIMMQVGHIICEYIEEHLRGWDGPNVEATPPTEATP
jgi:D-sedoheptulose 7-phosphate isomerase